MHCGVSFLFPKGQGLAVAGPLHLHISSSKPSDLTGVYECEDCKAAGQKYCFRGFDPGAIKMLPDVVRSELYDPWVITPQWIAERSLVNRVRCERDNTHDFGNVIQVVNEEKVMAAWDLTEQWMHGMYTHTYRP